MCIHLIQYSKKGLAQYNLVKIAELVDNQYK
jgi:hypothetical protein